METDRLVAIILNYNTPELSIKLAKKLGGWMINTIVVDNNSKDNSRELLKKELDSLDRVRLLFLKENIGYAKGNNAGIAFAIKYFTEIEYIAIINPDIEIISKESLNNMVKALKEDDHIAGITALTIYNNYFYGYNPCATKLLSPGQLIFSDVYPIKKLIRREYSKFEVVANNVAYVDKVQGCFFIMKKNIFSEIGFFDEGTFLYYEEDIIAEKIRQKNMRMGVLLTECIKHNHSLKDIEMQNYNRRKFYNECTLQSKKHYMLDVLKTKKSVWRISYIFDFATRMIKDLFVKLRGNYGYK